MLEGVLVLGPEREGEALAEECFLVLVGGGVLGEELGLLVHKADPLVLRKSVTLLQLGGRDLLVVPRRRGLFVRGHVAALAVPNEVVLLVIGSFLS